MKVVFLIILFYVNSVQAQKLFNIEGIKYKLDLISSGHDIIWGFELINVNTMMMTQKSGKISILKIDSSTVSSIKNIPEVYNVGQGGLLDLALDPDFKKNQLIYITYSKKVGNKQTTALARSKIDLKKLEFESWQELFVANAYSTNDHHYGSRIFFDKSFLFMTVGDRGHDHLAQSLKVHNGKVIRLHRDGSTPKDNPFVNTPDALPEIWSYGHRNPQGLFWDSLENKLYEQEHGPKGGDEINIIEAGRNYGWPVISYGKEYSGKPVGKGLTKHESMEQPIKYFVPSIAPSGLLKYSSGKLAAFKGSLVSGALVQEHLNIYKLNCMKDCEIKILDDLGERIRDVKEGMKGEIFFSTDSGKIFRISNTQ